MKPPGREGRKEWQRRVVLAAAWMGVTDNGHGKSLILDRGSKSLIHLGEIGTAEEIRPVETAASSRASNERRRMGLRECHCPAV